MSFTRTEEKKLVLLAKRGDSDAMTAIYKEFETEILRAAYGITKNGDDAQDIASEAFITFFRTIDRFDTKYPIRPWLHRILHNQASSFFRKKNKYVSGDDYFTNYSTEEASNTTENMFNQEQRELLQLCMDYLSEKERKILELFYIQNFSICDVAAYFKIPEGTAKSRLFTARKKLSVHIQRHLKGGTV